MRWFWLQSPKFFDWKLYLTQVKAVFCEVNMIFSCRNATLELAILVHWSVCMSNSPSKSPSVTFLNCERFLQFCPCPTIPDCPAVYPALFWSDIEKRPVIRNGLNCHKSHLHVVTFQPFPPFTPQLQEKWKWSQLSMILWILNLTWKMDQLLFYSTTILQPTAALKFQVHFFLRGRIRCLKTLCITIQSGSILYDVFQVFHAFRFIHPKPWWIAWKSLPDNS